MIRRTALLSALTLTLLLSACNSKNKDSAAAGEGTEAQAAAGVPATVEVPAEVAPPERKMDYWRVVGPLVAGSYSGTCVRMPDGRKMEAAITIGADGKASAGGLNVDFRPAKMAALMRARNDKGQYSALATLYVDDNKGGMLSLQSSQGGNDGSASLARDDIGLVCSNIRGADTLNAQPMYRALSKLLEGKKQTIGCLDSKNLLVRRNVDVEVVDGVVKIGDASFDMKAADSEGFTFDDAGGSLSLAISMPDERTIYVMYDGAGKLMQVLARHKDESTHFCSGKD
jgi:hypothetical protein